MADDAMGDGLPKAGPRGLGADKPAPRGRATPVRGSLNDDVFGDTRPASGQAGLDRLLERLPTRGGAPVSMAGLIWFCVAFVAPVLIALIYYGLIASSQYVVEFHFAVDQPLADANAQTVNTNTVRPSVLGRSTPSANDNTENNYEVVDYITSAQAARDLDHAVDLRSMFSKDGVDPFSRFNPKAPVEALEKFWRSMAYATYDPATGLAIAKVRAFSAADAYAIATNLIQLCNAEINAVGQRSRADSVRYAQMEVDRAQQQMDAVRTKLQSFRAQNGVIDPTKDAEPGVNTLATSLRANLTTLETRYQYLIGQLHNPSAPQLLQIRAQIAATQAQLAGTHAKQGEGLSATVGSYEQLDDQRQAAETALLTALVDQQGAIMGATAQRQYLTTYVAPALPESSTFPNRLGSIGLVTLVSGLIWLIGLLVGKSVMEHAR